MEYDGEIYYIDESDEEKVRKLDAILEERRRGGVGSSKPTHRATPKQKSKRKSKRKGHHDDKIRVGAKRKKTRSAVKTVVPLLPQADGSPTTPSTAKHFVSRTEGRWEVGSGGQLFLVPAFDQRPIYPPRGKHDDAQLAAEILDYGASLGLPGHKNWRERAREQFGIPSVQDSSSSNSSSFELLNDSEERWDAKQVEALSLESTTSFFAKHPDPTDPMLRRLIPIYPRKGKRDDAAEIPDYGPSVGLSGHKGWPDNGHKGWQDNVSEGHVDSQSSGNSLDLLSASSQVSELWREELEKITRTTCGCHQKSDINEEAKDEGAENKREDDRIVREILAAKAKDEALLSEDARCAEMPDAVESGAMGNDVTFVKDNEGGDNADGSVDEESAVDGDDVDGDDVDEVELILSPQLAALSVNNPAPKMFEPACWPYDVPHLLAQFNSKGLRLPFMKPLKTCSYYPSCSLDTCRNALGGFFCDADCCPYDGVGVCKNGLAEHPWLRLVKRVGTDDYAVIAKQPIPAGTNIGQYVGELSRIKRPTQQSMEASTERNGGFRLIMGEPAVTKKGWCILIDAERAGGMMRFANHSCKPVADFKQVYNRRVHTVVASTITDVARNAEITVSYGPHLWFYCDCNESTCRMPRTKG